jgi:hypothetical protein
MPVGISTEPYVPGATFADQKIGQLPKQDIEKMIPKKRPLSRAGKQNS